MTSKKTTRNIAFLTAFVMMMGVITPIFTAQEVVAQEPTAPSVYDYRFYSSVDPSQTVGGGVEIRTSDVQEAIKIAADFGSATVQKYIGPIPQQEAGGAGGALNEEIADQTPALVQNLTKAADILKEQLPGGEAAGIRLGGCIAIFCGEIELPF